jgi:hypothetical protein
MLLGRTNRVAILHIIHGSFTLKTLENTGSVNHVNLVNDYSHILDNSIQRQTGSVYRDYCGKRFTSFTSFTSLVIPTFSCWPMLHGWFTSFTVARKGAVASQVTGVTGFLLFLKYYVLFLKYYVIPISVLLLHTFPKTCHTCHTCQDTAMIRLYV